MRLYFHKRGRGLFFLNLEIWKLCLLNLWRELYSGKVERKRIYISKSESGREAR